MKNITRGAFDKRSLGCKLSSTLNTSIKENDTESKVRGLASEIQFNIKGADLGEDEAVGSRIYSSSSTPALHGAHFLKNREFSRVTFVTISFIKMKKTQDLD
ncbi:hypothetical protein FANTH_1468 [Fusarium anthophilum]|uniref:Uncharacterized protein n=1 Tax=Fusarium anthophilum TaxID=48485 RepID=A0A8H5EB45_9HYPO|nr:hypothetical protein FANTH_1468 [Fusarium anthophilum]